MSHSSKTNRALLLFLALFISLPLFAQPAQKVETAQAAPRTLFHLDFVVSELDGKRILSSRNYSVSVAANDPHQGSCSIRSGSRVPIATQSSSKDARETQYQYLDVGVNIDCSEAETVGSELTFILTADVSSILDTPADSQSLAPALRSTRWRSPVLVSIGKPNIVFTSEIERTNHTIQLEVTATPLH